MKRAIVMAILVAGRGAFAAEDCSALEAQLERDKQAVERQRATIGMGLDELDHWTKENTEAQERALHAAWGLLIDGVVGKFAESLSGKLEEAERLFGKTKGDIRRADPAFIAWLVDLRKQRDRLKLLVAGVRPMERKGEELVTTFERLRTSAREARDVAGEISRLLARSAKDKAIKAILTQVALQAASSEFERQWMSKKAIPFLDNAYDFGKAVVEYGYDVVAWTASRNRILQQNKLADKQLEAVEALRCQIERTVAKLVECRGERPPRVTERCRKPAAKCGTPPFAIPDECRGHDRPACQAALVAPCTRYLEEFMAARGKKVTRNDCAPCSHEWAEGFVPAQ